MCKIFDFLMLGYFDRGRFAFLLVGYFGRCRFEFLLVGYFDRCRVHWEGHLVFERKGKCTLRVTFWSSHKFDTSPRLANHEQLKVMLLICLQN